VNVRARLRQLLAPTLKRHSPRLWTAAVSADRQVERVRHSVARHLPILLRPEPRQIEIAITALCNLRCIGCRYGRDFMPGEQLDLTTVRQLLDDAKNAGIWEARFYGGEPLLHRDLPRMIEHSVRIGMQPYLTTNGLLLEQRAAEVYDAGLRQITVGFYGTGAKYDSYVQRKDRFGRVEAGIAAVRDRYGMDVGMRINWLLMRPSCNLDDLDAACRFAEKYSLRIQVDLIHYSLPYFTEGPDRMLQFSPEDEPAIRRVADDILRRKRETPGLFTQSLTGLASIPDWLLKGPDMRVPCDAHNMIWVGADGTVQMCYVTFRLGNLHEQRLRDMLFTATHREAARDALAVNCPNCHCKYDRRVEKHAPLAKAYGRLLAASESAEPMVPVEAPAFGQKASVL
jgi:cyclic pyranopterin phosphate synthase